jgi:hypothetical protein
MKMPISIFSPLLPEVAELAAAGDVAEAGELLATPPSGELPLPTLVPDAVPVLAVAEVWADCPP